MFQTTNHIYIYITYNPTYLHALTNEIWGVNIGQTVTIRRCGRAMVSRSENHLQMLDFPHLCESILGYMILCGKQSWLGVTINMISNNKFHKPILGMVYTVYYWVCHIVWYSQLKGFIGVQTTTITKHASISLDWLKGKFTGKPHVEWENRWFPVKIFP